MFNSIYFKMNSRIRDAASGGRPISIGENSDGVAVMQAALADLGYLMPNSTNHTKILDGRFGAETLAALKSFQSQVHVSPVDGKAGAATLAKLDQRLVSKYTKPIAPPVKHRPGRPPIKSAGSMPVASGLKFEDANFRSGTGDPPLTRDPGAGVWNSKEWTFSMATLKAAIKSQLNKANLYPGPNSVAHMRHYFAGTGNNYTIALESMISSVPQAQKAFLSEFRQAQKFVMTLPVGRHQFTSRFAESAYNYKSQSADWYFAIGGYSYWGKGSVNITQVGGEKIYDLEFIFKFFDRYNWDGGKSVTLGPITITDEFMGEFHRQGLAREFDCYGEVRRRLNWRGTVAVPTDSKILSPAGR